jgi:Family of unknown function (DUF6279)
MRESFSKLCKRTAIIGLCLVVLAGCSAARLGYNQGPQLAHWWLDGYLDFNDEQSARVRTALNRWFEWHRRTQLTDYAALLAQVRTRLDGPIDASVVCQWNDQIRARIEPALMQVLPPAAEIVRTLTPAQLVVLEKRYAKNIAKAREEYLQPDRADRVAASVARTVERFESFYGRLDESQRRLVADAVATSPAEPGSWIAASEQRQREAIEVLRRIIDEKPDAARTQQMLRDLARRFDGSPQPATAAAQQRVVQYSCELTARLHNSTTPEQRRAARDKLRGWEGDMRQLAAEASPATAAQADLPR